jgi:hypothetical protein
LTASDRDGRLTGNDGVKFFERSGLPRELLAKVWANADNRRQGFLDFNAFVRALELVSLAQVCVWVSGWGWNVIACFGREEFGCAFGLPARKRPAGCWR